MDENEEYKKLKSSLGDAASLKLRANAAKDSGNFYQTERSFDALQAAAENESEYQELCSQENNGWVWARVANGYHKPKYKSQS